MSPFTTKILSSKSDSYLPVVVEVLQNKDIVAIPTETVYGLAGNAFSEIAIEKIYHAKGRPSDNPLIVHIGKIDDLSHLVKVLSKDALLLAEAFWPGPLTMILPRSSKIPTKTAGGLDSVAIRMPAHPVALEIINTCGFPLAAPSANLSGAPSPTTADHVYHDLKGRIPYIVDGGSCIVGLESTVLSLLEETPKILRPGAISPEEISLILGKPVLLDKNILHALNDGTPVASPGMKYQHYAPNTPLTLFFGDRDSYIEKVKEENWGALCFQEDLPFLEKASALSYGKKEDFREQSAQLFLQLRAIDDLDLKQVLVHVSSDPKVLPILNRLLRSAAFRTEGNLPHFLERM